MPDDPDKSLFYSHETEGPFDHCFACSLPLDDPDLPFLVAKSFHRGECNFEYAICEDCRANMSEEFSEESRQRLAEFFDRRVQIGLRSLLFEKGDGPAPWVANCAACGVARDKAESYSIGGIFLGSDMLYDPYPLCLCGKCEEEIQECLSKKTRDIWDDFVDTHFDGPPADTVDLPVGGKPLPF